MLDELKLGDVPDAEAPQQLHDFLMQNHMVFSLRPGECGETDIVTMSINTGEHTLSDSHHIACHLLSVRK